MLFAVVVHLAFRIPPLMLKRARRGGRLNDTCPRRLPFNLQSAI
jgi:hypothetical protein